MGFKQIKSESVVQQIIDAFSDEIMKGELRPGDKVPTEMELAEKFGVGRNSVREAVKILVYMGVLEIRRAEGTFVCEGFQESMIDPMVFGIILDNAKDGTNLMELREIMEAGVMQLAMRNASPKEFSDLGRKLNLLKTEIELGPDNMENIFEADNQFHNEISKMGHNPLLTKLEDVVRVLTYAMRYQSVKNMIDSGRGEELYKAHADLMEVLKTRNTENLNTAVRNSYFDQVEPIEI
ncbi:MAG: FadR family transcriptional regulator [Eubacterium sp.]|nr:FadR family transcriptional regulator [Eubacterium sp.]